MTIASYYVLEEIIGEPTRENIEKFLKRYPKDSELRRIYEGFVDDMDSDKLMRELSDLTKVRKFGGSGGTSLNMRDRRHMKGDF